MCIQTRINSVSLCSLGLCYGHRVLRVGSTGGESEVLEDVAPGGFPCVEGRLALMDITNLARDIAAHLGTDGSPDVQIILANASEEVVLAFVQAVLDKVETIGGYDLTTYEEDDDDELDDEYDDDDDDDDGDDRWPGDTDDD